MSNRRVAGAALAIALLLPGGALAACDQEDVRDVEEGAEEVEKEVDEADTDGKDD